ncbi:division/cell wall cluster transcriptional repressor MraZ [Mycoplasma zalophi]|uniref:Transcriptional regulator MraZ n=1 Tax=Mycoplasma zalophi TaxID=191287 RepID=A0ABS6DQH4_9MOLU|nr:division/cell wall cluster transcriptional repressor MraZ [Mycoplasma zalophi]MBU4691355.1 division/cell wall cluster transcriptional repressor MraZ [Mycoplasma zalophi]MBU4692581.1 division/cell wall cluster transcriptional repressor MraZ [Mycoplasma zalophi]
MYGNYERTLDEKNRIVVPVKFREELGNNFFITFGLDNSLTLRSQEEFNKLTKKLTENNMLDKNMRQFNRFILSNTEEIKLDKSGRFVIPTRFLERAAIKKDIIFIGVGNVSEIFAKEIYDQDIKSIDETQEFDNLAQLLFESGAKL